MAGLAGRDQAGDDGEDPDERDEAVHGRAAARAHPCSQNSTSDFERVAEAAAAFLTVAMRGRDAARVALRRRAALRRRPRAHQARASSQRTIFDADEDVAAGPARCA